ncbi:DNA-binding response OmpR family regulator [Anaerotaenia torta]|uniref:response regulator transcription factor n=1 Tax=Anaerotaenia torta TaxID=433293 RepID=UPI003D24A7BC
MRILMVEDEKYIAKAVAEVLKKNHYAVDLAHDGQYGLDCALSNIYDIIILDIMLPERDGLSILKEIRRNRIETPVILLTARGQLEDKVQGLDLGADDYLAKPFHTDELLARLRALGRRKTRLLNDGTLTFGDLQLLPHALMLKCSGSETRLTLKETQLLELLIDHKNRIISKDTIIEKIWGYDTEAVDNHVEAHISLLRKKLAEVRSGTMIRTIRGAGYTLVAGEDGR